MYRYHDSQYRSCTDIATVNTDRVQISRQSIQTVYRYRDSQYRSCTDIATVNTDRVQISRQSIQIVYTLSTVTADRAHVSRQLQQIVYMYRDGQWRWDSLQIVLGIAEPLETVGRYRSVPRCPPQSSFTVNLQLALPAHEPRGGARAVV